MLVFLIAGIIGKSVGFDFLLSRPENRKAEQEGVAFNPNRIGFAQGPDGS